MAPYRSESDRDDERAEERTLAWLLLVIGAIRVAIGVVEREVFRAEATTALLMIALGLAMLACTPRRTR